MTSYVTPFISEASQDSKLPSWEIWVNHEKSFSWRITDLMIPNASFLTMYNIYHICLHLQYCTILIFLFHWFFSPCSYQKTKQIFLNCLYKYIWKFYIPKSDKTFPFNLIPAALLWVYISFYRWHGLTQWIRLYYVKSLVKISLHFSFIFVVCFICCR